MLFETNRCLIKTIEIDDKIDYLSLADDINVWNYLGGVGTAEWHRNNAQNLENLSSDYFASRWIIRDKQTKKFLGYIAMDTHHDGDYIELAYMLLSDYWGQGYATEVANAIIQYAFKEKGLPRIVAEVQTVNKASCHVLEKLGFYKLKELMRFNAEQTLYAIDNPQTNHYTP